MIRGNLGRKVLWRREQIVVWSRLQQYLGLHGNEGIVNQRRHSQGSSNLINILGNKVETKGSIILLHAWWTAKTYYPSSNNPFNSSLLYSCNRYILVYEFIVHATDWIEIFVPINFFFFFFLENCTRNGLQVFLHVPWTTVKSL